MTTVDLTTLIKRSPAVVGTMMGDELVTVHAETGRYFGLAGTGPRLWELLEQPATVERLVDAIVAEYAVDEKTCREETINYIRQLLEAGLVRPID